jgi:hypothetical protein
MRLESWPTLIALTLVEHSFRLLIFGRREMLIALQCVFYSLFCFVYVMPLKTPIIRHLAERQIAQEP